jgi:hypothetical protein
MIPWKPIAAGLVALALIFAGWRIHNAIWQAGYDARTAEIAAAIERKLEDANTADDASMRCAADSECRMRDDGFRRD